MQIPVTQINAAGGAMTQLYDNIASGAIASWDVSGISQAYNHLMIRCNARGDNVAANVNGFIRYNNDSAAKYDQQLLYQNNLTNTLNAIVAQTSLYIGFVPSAGATAGKAGPCTVDIPDYTSTVFHKGSVSHNGMSTTEGAGGQFMLTSYGLWRSTAAITRITVFPSAGNFVAGSRLTIYGLL